MLVPTDLTSALVPRIPSPVEEILDDRLVRRGVRLLLKRDDLIHPEIPGNKWRKLTPNLVAAQAAGHRRLLTFGGAFSNHLRAVAAAGHHLGFSTIGVVRGEEHLPLNPSLAYAVSRGMHLTYLERGTYRRKTTPAVIAALRERYGDFYLVPEGGSNEHGVRGCADIPRELDADVDVVCCPVGTGGTLAGIAGGLSEGQHAVGVAALKGGEYLNGEIVALQERTFGRVTGNWTLETGFHFGGFARRNSELDRFIETIHRQHGLVVDWVYVAKMLYGVFTLVERGEILEGSTVVAIVTG